MRRSSLLVHLLFVLAVACLELNSFESVALGGDGSVSATVAPSELKLTPGGSATGVLLVSNSGTTPVEQLHVTPVAADPSVITVRMEATDSGVAAGGSISFTFQVGRSTVGTGQDLSVHFVVTFRQAVGGSPVPGPGATSSPLPVAQAILAKLTITSLTSADILSAKLEGASASATPTAINENQPADASLVLTNPREAPVRVDNIQVTAPTSIDVTLTCPSGDELKVASGTTASTKCLERDRDAVALTLGPRAEQILRVKLSAADAVIPGPRALVVRIDATSDDAHTSASIMTNLALTLGVFAESEILKAVGAPIFLFLPGVIIALTAWFLIRRWSPWRGMVADASLGGIASNGSFLALVSLAMSLVVAVIYPTLTKRIYPGHERNFLAAYGFHDFYYVFGYSFAIAVGAWALSWAAYAVLHSLFIPAEGDGPADLLRKVGLRGLIGGSTLFRTVSVDGKRGLDLARAGSRVLIGPVIAARVARPSDFELAQAIEDDANQDRARSLWWRVRSAVLDRKVEISYAGDLEAPLLIDDSSKVHQTGQLVSIVQVPPRT